MDFEEQLQEQLAEQQEAWAGVQELLAADPGSEEMTALLAELQDGMRETEAALLGLKRQRLLQELDALHGGSNQQQQQQQQQQQGEEGGQASDTAAPAASAATEPAAHLQPGAICVFRQTDGRHYFGRVLESHGGTVSLQPLLPTRAHQLEHITLPAAALHPGPASLEPAAGALQAGMRAWVQPPGQALWAAAELSEVDPHGQRVAAIRLADKRRLVLPFAAVALHAHAPDPHASDGSGDEGGGGQSLAAGSLAGGSGEEDSELSGSDMSFSGSEEEEEEGAAEGRRPGMRRVASALQDAADRVQQQAEAGAQTDTALFFASEKHSRGIGSKLLATMGYRGMGHGLGRRQHGMEHALQARRVKPGAGLGVDGGKGIEEGKRKCKSGKQRRRDKAAQERAEQREAAQQAQQELERRTGNEGLFAVLDSLIGDSSQAQQAKDASLGVHSGRGSAAAGGGTSVGGTSRQGHLFVGSAAAAGSGPGGKKPAAKEEDRRALAQRADALAQLRLKVKRLEEMEGRNKRDKVMLPQIERALREARAQLAGAEAQHAASSKAISDKEKLRKMTKF